MVKMVNPELEVVWFENEDVIADSFIEYSNGVFITRNGEVVADGTRVKDGDKSGTVSGGQGHVAGNGYTNGYYYYHDGVYTYRQVGQ